MKDGDSILVELAQDDASNRVWCAMFVLRGKFIHRNDQYVHMYKSENEAKMHAAMIGSKFASIFSNKKLKIEMEYLVDDLQIW